MQPSHSRRVLGRVIKISFVLFVAAVNLLIIWRVFFSANVPSSLKPLTPTASLTEAYTQHGDELTLRYQNIYTTTYGKNNAGYFTISQYAYIPDANQFQVVVRYNNSTLRNLQKDYGLAELPEKALEWFEFSLVKTTDLTPDDPNDNNKPETLGRERIAPSTVTRDETSLYTYYRLVFENVPIEAQTDGVFLDVYYLQDINYENEAYGRLCLYDCREEWLETKLSKADREALSNP